MRARVKDRARYPSVRSAGIVWTRDWQEVPAWAEQEISVNPFLEIEREPVPEPQTAKTTAAQLITPKASAKGKRKL